MVELQISMNRHELAEQLSYLDDQDLKVVLKALIELRPDMFKFIIHGEGRHGKITGVDYAENGVYLTVKAQDKNN